MALPPPSSVVSLLTDFGGDDPYVGIMKGALLRAHRAAVIVDVTHAVPPQDVAAASFHVAALPDRFPAGTVHVAVVDPGVGTDRRALAVSAADAYWIAPDNGVLEPVLARPEAEVVAIDAERLRLAPLLRRLCSRLAHMRAARCPKRGPRTIRPCEGVHVALELALRASPRPAKVTLRRIAPPSAAPATARR